MLKKQLDHSSSVCRGALLRFVTLSALFCVNEAVTTSLLQQESAAANLPLPQRLKQLSRLVKPECDIRLKSKHLRLPILKQVFRLYSLQTYNLLSKLTFVVLSLVNKNRPHFSLILLSIFSPLFILFFKKPQRIMWGMNPKGEIGMMTKVEAML